MQRRLALITGGTSGIGFGVSKKLANEYDLALSYGTNTEKARRAKDELEGSVPGLKVQIYGGNLFQYAEAKNLVEAVRNDFGKSPSVLVNCGGRIRDGLFLGSDFQQHFEQIQEHLIVTMALCHLVIKDMYRDKFGRIVNLSSISASFAKKGQANYAAAKGGIEAFTRTLALELAHRGITVNAIAPGLIETPMTEAIMAKIEASVGVASRVPAGYAGKPEDIGNLVRFLVSEDARYITGTVMTVDGGRSLGDPA